METQLSKTEVLQLYKTSNSEGKKLLSDKYGKEMFDEETINIDEINSIDDIIKFSKPDDEVLAIVSYKGEKSKLINAANNVLREMLAELYNEGHVVNYEKGEKGWTPVFDCSNGGFAFSDSHYDDWITYTFVGSRFAFKSEKLADKAGQKFPQLFRGALMKY